MSISRYRGLSARRGGGRHNRRDHRQRLRTAGRCGDVRDERIAFEPDPLAGRARTTAAPNFARELREGWQAFTEHTWVWLLTLWISLYFLVTYAPFFVLGPYIAKNSLGGASAWAIIVTGEAIGALAGGLLGLRLRPRRAMVRSEPSSSRQHCNARCWRCMRRRSPSAPLRSSPVSRSRSER